MLQATVLTHLEPPDFDLESGLRQHPPEPGGTALPTLGSDRITQQNDGRPATYQWHNHLWQSHLTPKLIHQVLTVGHVQPSDVRNVLRAFEHVFDRADNAEVLAQFPKKIHIPLTNIKEISPEHRASFVTLMSALNRKAIPEKLFSTSLALLENHSFVNELHKAACNHAEVRSHLLKRDYSNNTLHNNLFINGLHVALRDAELRTNTINAPLRSSLLDQACWTHYDSVGEATRKLFETTYKLDPTGSVRSALQKYWLTSHIMFKDLRGELAPDLPPPQVQRHLKQLAIGMFATELNRERVGLESSAMALSGLLRNSHLLATTPDGSKQNDTYVVNYYKQAMMFYKLRTPEQRKDEQLSIKTANDVITAIHRSIRMSQAAKTNLAVRSSLAQHASNIPDVHERSQELDALLHFFSNSNSNISES